MTGSGVEITGQFPNPTRAVAIVREEGHRSMGQAIGLLDAEVKRRMPHRTGHARRTVHSVVYVRGNLIFAVLTVGAFYAVYLEFGTGLYGPRNRWIVPVRARALRFPAGGSPSLVAGGGTRQRGSAGTGRTLAGRVRSGRAGAGAGWVFAQRVRGIRPRRMVRDSVFITRPRAERVFVLGGRRAAQRIQAELTGGR